MKQDVDIWSVGCVTSEVVTWASQGSDKVLDYRRRRLEEVHRLTGRREESFHDDSGNLLQTVRDVHDENVKNCRRNDELTKPIIKDLVSEMLLNSDEHRPNAKYLYRKSKRIIKEVLGSFDDITPRRSPNLPSQSPPLKRPIPGRRGGSSGSNYLEPTQSIPPISSLDSQPSPGEMSQNPNSSFYYVPSAQNSQRLRGYSNTEYYSPPLSSDESSYFGPNPAYDTFNKYHQSQLAYLPEKADPWDPRFRGRRPSINDLGNLPPTSDNPASQAKKGEDWRPPPALSVQAGLDLLQKNTDFPDKHLMEELQGRDHVCRNYITLWPS